MDLGIETISLDSEEIKKAPEPPAAILPGGPAEGEPIYSIAYWRGYFEVNTATVLRRLQKTLKPQSGEFFLDEKPDLYAPFWIVLTLVFCLSLTSSLVHYEIGALPQPG
jgi:hypothetical protein